jgi:hypothetical protein
MESEYVAAVTEMQEGLFFQNVHEELNVMDMQPLHIATDSAATKAYMEKLGLSGSRAKHMQLRQAFAKDLVKGRACVFEQDRISVERSRHADETFG